MHYHLEIIMPPCSPSEIEARVSEIMAPWEEGGKDEYGDEQRHGFWDWYEIGGRYTGSHRRASFDPEKLSVFYDAIRDAGVQIKGLVLGKEELATDADRAKVESLWREFFPDDEIGCQDFKDYDGADVDYRTVEAIGKHLSAYRVIVADWHEWKEERNLRAKRMLTKEIWNGVEHQDAKWTGSVPDLISEVRSVDNWRSVDIGDDWLCVTVDYHS